MESVEGEITIKCPLTEKEDRIMLLLVQAHNMFLDLDQTHPSEKGEWTIGLHFLQKHLLTRAMRRDYPNYLPTYKETKDNEGV